MISFIHRLIVVITFVSVHCEGNVRMLSFTEVVEVREKIQTVSASQTVGQVSRTQCSSLCISSNTCVSFFYVGETKTCHLHDVVFPVAAVSTSSPSTRYYIPSCDESTPPFSNITQLSLNGEENMRYFCGHPGDLTELACASSGHVVIYACRKPTSCADIRNFTSKPVDGHYWLYPPGLGGQDQARIYCHNMGTTPEEFVSLPVPNSGVYPEEELVPCSGPKRYSVIGNQWGSWTYNKIKIDLKTMAVDQGDRAFATWIGTAQDYGVAQDCYHNHGATRGCGPVGTFTIDTTGTGFRVNPSLSWKSIGWMPWTIFSRENNGLVVNLNCGGYCGGCSPDGVLTLQSYKPDEPSVSAATLLPIVYEVVQKVP
ncbi:A disintegrin and metalloproteinase with thrombospondin motifs 20-like isoform X1 [Haliotis asinina]|uniref:A disintegrin and metalloproteinase with thrombospondin motifs 20-like isoform X1 n=1 Tax=Haliotis asinina TaxID=109174 RepID=UPI0035322EA2